MAFSQNLLGLRRAYTVVTSDYVPGLRLEFARFLGETGHFKLNFPIGNSNFSQFFVSGIHINTFSHSSAGKKISFHGHFNNNRKYLQQFSRYSRQLLINFLLHVIKFWCETSLKSIILGVILVVLLIKVIGN